MHSFFLRGISPDYFSEINQEIGKEESALGKLKIELIKLLFNLISQFQMPFFPTPSHLILFFHRHPSENLTNITIIKTFFVFELYNCF